MENFVTIILLFETESKVVLLMVYSVENKKLPGAPSFVNKQSVFSYWDNNYCCFKYLFNGSMFCTWLLQTLLFILF